MLHFFALSLFLFFFFSSGSISVVFCQCTNEAVQNCGNQVTDPTSFFSAVPEQFWRVRLSFQTTTFSQMEAAAGISVQTTTASPKSIASTVNSYIKSLLVAYNQNAFSSSLLSPTPTTSASVTNIVYDYPMVWFDIDGTTTTLAKAVFAAIQLMIQNNATSTFNGVTYQASILGSLTAIQQMCCDGSYSLTGDCSPCKGNINYLTIALAAVGSVIGIVLICVVIMWVKDRKKRAAELTAIHPVDDHARGTRPPPRSLQGASKGVHSNDAVSIPILPPAAHNNPSHQNTHEATNKNKEEKCAHEEKEKENDKEKHADEHKEHGKERGRIGKHTSHGHDEEKDKDKHKDKHKEKHKDKDSDKDKETKIEMPNAIQSESSNDADKKHHHHHHHKDKEKEKDKE